MNSPRPISRTALADIVAERALIAIVLGHLVLFAAFVVSLVSAGAALSAPFGGCEGDNLVDRLRRDDPAKFAAVLKQAAMVENGRGVFWKIEKAGVSPSYLLGTMHSADPRIATLSPAVQSAFDGAQTIIVESTEALDRQKMQAAMVALKEVTFLADGTTLDAMMPPDAVDRLKDAVEARRMPWTLVRHMQPWMVAAAISIPVCEIAAKNAGAPVLDGLLARMAQEKGKQLVGLETVAEQFAAVAAIPHEFHVNALNETLTLGR